MTSADALIHIVADFGTGNDTCAQAIALQQLLASKAEVHAWTTGGLPAYPGAPRTRRIYAFGGDYPVGGTLIVVGPRQALVPWIERCRARRIIIYSDTRDAEALFRLCAHLRSTTLPESELAFSSRRLIALHGVPGRFLPPLIKSEQFAPSIADSKPVLGVPLSQSDHASRLSLCKSCALSGIDVHLLVQTAGTAIPNLPAGITLVPPFRQAPERRFSALNMLYVPGEPAARLLLEAMAAGCAIVANGPELGEWIADGENGYLTDCAEQAWNRIMAIAHDADLRKRLGAAAMRRASELSGPEARSAVVRWLVA